ncbi:MACPF domain-containing protein 4 [Plakobranchus ocellatus]|uniref:MACPF domain-containing protein 4 n=1 Tax=Plakobranchus ocellatus TaxID=259542 RepID=A0AAV4D7V6_9GAST|nr:MACPF domain-containing protein 4 [Plakobranchus ocellatus]
MKKELQRDNEDEPQSTFDVSVSRRITKDIRETFLQITWPVATFGTYRCGVIGFEWKTHGSVTEVASEVVIWKGEVTVEDMMDVFKYWSDKLARVEAARDKLTGNMNTFNESFKSCGERIDFQNSEGQALSQISLQRVVTDTSSLGFCCTTSGLYQTPITLPTHSPFMLYRRGGQCQVIGGTVLSSVVFSIDTENGYNSDSKDANGPDIDLPIGYLTKLYVYHYTSS